MARQNITPNVAQKLFEAYLDYSGGHVSEISNERLKDNEFPVLENADLSGRGSAMLRYGREDIFPSYPYDTTKVKGQGIFFYYRQGQPEPDMIVAVDGQLWRVDKQQNTTLNHYKSNTLESLKNRTLNDLTTPYILIKIPIMDSSKITDPATREFTFQKEKSIDAVQYKTDMFFATGTKLCELTFDTSDAWVLDKDYTKDQMIKHSGNVYKCKTAGKSTAAPTHLSGDWLDAGTGTGTLEWSFVSYEWSAKIVVPYSPTNMEAIYIGTNGLADDPNAYVKDTVGEAIKVAGIQPDKRKGNVNQITKFTAFVVKTSESQALDYMWQYRKSSDTSWITGRTWTADTAGGKTWDFTPDTIIPYDIKCDIRQTGTSSPTATLTLQAYDVYPTEDKLLNKPLDSSAMHRCRRIILHWDRLLLAQDDRNPYQMYISDLAAPRYFPSSNTIHFDTGKQEPITAIVKYRGLLVVFTKSTIQTLSGKDVSTYIRNLVHDSIGCTAGSTAKVVGNNIIFLSHEGIMMIKPNQLILEAMNVQRIDYPIKSEVPNDENACAIVSDGQYFLCFPNHKIIYRLYYDAGMWVRDKSSKLDIIQFAVYGETVYNITSTGKVYRHNENVFTDSGEPYKMVLESKFLDLSASFNYKKLKKLHVLAKHFTTHDVKVSVKVQADSAIVLDPEIGQATVDPITGEVVWNQSIEPNMEFNTGTSFGNWVLGKSAFGDVALSVQKAAVRGKARRIKVTITYEGGKACEIYGFGLEFKLKKP